MGELAMNHSCDQFNQTLADILKVTDYCQTNFKPFNLNCNVPSTMQDISNKALQTRFENLGITPTDDIKCLVNGVDFALLNGNALFDVIYLLNVYHTTFVNAGFKDETALNDVLEQARSNISRQSLLDLLVTFCDYSFVLGDAKKQIILSFLYEKMIHEDIEIRRQAATVIACLFVADNSNNKQSINSEINLIIDRFLKSDVTTSEQQSARLGSALESFTSTLIEKSKVDDKLFYVDTIVLALQRYRRKAACFPYVLAVLAALSAEHCSQSTRVAMLQIVKNIIIVSSSELKLEALYTYCGLLEKFKLAQTEIAEKHKIETEYVLVEKYFYQKITNSQKYDYLSEINISDMYISNLKVATPRVVKLVQIDLLSQLIESGEADSFYTALHFSNVLKVSADYQVSQRAGDALYQIFDGLTAGQKNDIVIELLLALEIQTYRFTKHIPHVLGRLIMKLPASEFYEIVTDFVTEIKGADEQIAILILDATQFAIEALLTASCSLEQIDDKLSALLKVIFNGLFHYKPAIAQHALRVLGRPLFYKSIISSNQKLLFGRIAKKLIVAITRQEDDYFGHLTKALTLNYLFAFKKKENLRLHDDVFSVPQNVAFFPGTFDPFSKAHLNSAVAIRNRGFEVYLAIDEFSWSKRTQPNQTRRKIIEMSIADESDIYIFPQNNIVNIANKSDLLNLKKLFVNREVYLVMGADVLTNASAYKKKDVKDVINSFSHVIFERSTGTGAAAQHQLEMAIKSVKGDVIRMTLSPEIERISSTQIRNCVDRQRDISDLIEKKAQQYIYNTALYRHEPLFKDTLTVRSTGVTVTELIDGKLIAEIEQAFAIDGQKIKHLLSEMPSDVPLRCLMIRDINNDNKLIACSLFHWLRSSMIYHEFPSDKISDYIRNMAVGRIVVIDTLLCHDSYHGMKLEQIVLTETLAFVMAKDYTYAIYKNALDQHTANIEQILKLQGFIAHCDGDSCIKVVDMSNPIILNLDCKSMIKAPYRDAPTIGLAIRKARQKLQQALCRFNKGSLVLSFDRTMLYEHLIKKICDVNGVDTYEKVPRQLGDKMCVTYGDLFKRWRIPNTVTKALHTERFYRLDFQSYDVKNAPNYLDLDIQTKTIKSFQRPVILVDDIFDKGYRLKAIMTSFNKYQIAINRLVAAILTGRGKAWLEMNDIAVESAYYIPKVKFWFNEAMLYPFIGGDAVQRQVLQSDAPLQSINLILPYVYPKFLSGVSKDKVADLSRACLESDIIVLQALEDEYLRVNGKGLTLKDLSAVLISSRIPYKRHYLNYDLKQSPVDVVSADADYLSKIISYYGEQNEQ